MTGRGVRFVVGLILGIAVGAFVKAMRVSDNHSEGATNG